MYQVVFHTRWFTYETCESGRLYLAITLMLIKTSTYLLMGHSKQVVESWQQVLRLI